MSRISTEANPIEAGKAEREDIEMEVRRGLQLVNWRQKKDAVCPKRIRKKLVRKNDFPILNVLALPSADQWKASSARRQINARTLHRTPCRAVTYEPFYRF